jgi:HEXXH motif-containing protein
MDIDWSRMAEPQEDQYDTDVIWELVTTTTTSIREEVHVRRPANDDLTIFDGSIAVRHAGGDEPLLPSCVSAPLNHLHILRAAELVRRWPAVFEQYRRLMDTFHPFTDTSIPEERRAVTLGSISHHDPHRFGVMYATVDDPLGLAQAFVHEMAHNKLFGLGLYLEHSECGLIKNPPGQLFKSPIRTDRPRPMTAVFHAQYSFMHVTELDVRLAEVSEGEAELRRVVRLLRRNVQRMSEGDMELRAHLEVDARGERFFDGFYRWSERVLDRGRALLSEHGRLLRA